jgi:hypothetical protein
VPPEKIARRKKAVLPGQKTNVMTRSFRVSTGKYGKYSQMNQLFFEYTEKVVVQNERFIELTAADFYSLITEKSSAPL